MKKVKCIKSIGEFVQGGVYKIVENTTLNFEILALNGETATFSKIHDAEYPNFRIYFELV